jgi:small GTP-binding protein
MATAVDGSPIRPLPELQAEYHFLTKAIIIGDSNVGKTSLLYRYTNNDWNPYYISTIGVDYKVLDFNIGGKVVRLQLWDTAGQDRFRTIVNSYYRGVHGVLLVFAHNNRASFDHLHEWLGDVERHAGGNPPIILVGSKSDAALEPDQKPITDEEALTLAKKLKATYVRTSSLTGMNVDAAFAELLEKCLEYKKRLADNPAPHSTPAPVDLERLTHDHKIRSQRSECSC